VRTRNSASIYRPTCIANLVNAALWVAYGIVSLRRCVTVAVPLCVCVCRYCISGLYKQIEQADVTNAINAHNSSSKARHLTPADTEGHEC
jgi:hypothetical protein